MILLDTCALLWLVADQTRLSEAACTELDRHRERVFVSAISAFEVAIKHRKGKLRLPMSPDDWYQTAVRFHRLSELPVTGEIAARSALLPPLHSDPCDRMIIATAQINDLAILTPDSLIQAYPNVETSW